MCGIAVLPPAYIKFLVTLKPKKIKLLSRNVRHICHNNVLLANKFQFSLPDHT